MAAPASPSKTVHATNARAKATARVYQP
jgi:hypothetical protein